MHRTAQRALMGGAAATLALCGILIAPIPAFAVIAPVDTLSDNPLDGFTLREAITQANTDAGADSITFAPGLTGDIVLGSTLTSTQGLTIVGNVGLTLKRDPAAGDFTLLHAVMEADGYSITVQDLDFAGSSALPFQIGYGFVAEPGGLGIGLEDVILRNVGIFNFVGPNDFEGGGALIHSAENVVIEESGFTSNVAGATRVGGGLYVENCGEISIASSVFESNSAAAGGAVAVVDSGSVHVEGTTFLLNHASGTTPQGGGAMYLNDVSGNVRIGTSRFLENNSDGAAGAIMFEGYTPDVDVLMQVADTTFADNRAAARGGAVQLVDFDGPAEFSRTTFERNTALDGEGGAIDVFDDPQSTESEFTSFGLFQSSFLSNAAAESGAGVHIDQVHAEASVRVSQSTFAGNVLTRDGRRGISISVGDNDGDVDISNVTVDETTDDDDIDYAVYMSSNDGNFDVASSTIVGPGALGVFGSDGQVTVTNTILDGGPNYQYADFTMSLDQSHATVSYLLIKQPLQAAVVKNGGIIIEEDHGLQPLDDFGGPTLTRLPLTTSPAVNAGDPGYAGPLTQDQRLLPRIVAGRIDIGAVERQADDPADPTEPVTPLPKPLPPTGSTSSPWAPLAGGAVLAVGFGALWFARIRRRTLGAAARSE
jgi:LPXTG-motif cell wall-anchored protein